MPQVINLIMRIIAKCYLDSNCTSGVNDGDIMDNMNSSTPGSSVTQEPSKKVKRSNSDSDMDSDEVKQYSPKNKASPEARKVYMCS